MRTFNINDNARERDIERAHALLASAYPAAIWRQVQEVHGDHAAIYFAAFLVGGGAVAIAALDPESGDVNVIPMTEADPDLYQLVALVFASEIGKWMARAARSLGQRQTIAPPDDICQAFVESAGGDDRPTESHEEASAHRDRCDELSLELEGVRAELAEALARLAKCNQERRAMPAGPEPFGPRIGRDPTPVIMSPQ